ncbi:putative bifunctional diguanylate cyclase/phosphodiesterase [Zestomonas thermotolerans]|uniref:putative bifunctional diguanylate cyclase/phosphodiesterase n=1 Tax=Zestomonas thermotolerans TaxID=157784 RepID=UPI0023F281E9|nr:EAL domain-containing protein [Pseudomonas thermotolerans]
MSQLSSALRLTLIYLLLAGAWIFLGAALTHALPLGGLTSEKVYLLRHVAFALLSALALYALLRAYERQQQRYRRELHRHDERLRQAAVVFEATQEGVLVSDAQMRIIHVNPAFTRITGYREDEVLGQTPRVLKSGRHDQAFYQAMWQSIAKTRSWSGEIWNRRKNGEIYPQWQNLRAIQDESGRTTHYVAVFSDISAIKHSQSELDYLAHHDLLTDLPNRLRFVDRVEHALEYSRLHQSGGAVMILDLDHFKYINESYGHNSGDQLLKAIGQRLRAHLREGITLARLGGDEFAVLYEDCQSPTQAAALARNLLEALQAPIEIDNRPLVVSGSIGISLYPRDAQSVEQLLRNADSALFKAKSEGRQTFVFYHQELTALSRQRIELTIALRQALDRGQLRLYFQPIVDLHNGRQVGAEALLRWQHPERGLVPPGEFIPLAEETGQIAQLDIWALEQACRQLAAWPHLEFLAVNISSRLFGRSELDSQVAEILARTGAEPRRLELEITESAVMDDPDAALELMRRLRQLGVRLAIDDFGTGYSSLARLKEMPVQKLKIDQSFVQGLADDCPDLAIVNSVITLGHSLGLKVLAEGIEQPEQAERLCQLGCDFGQGYLFGRPQPASPEPLTQGAT